MAGFISFRNGRRFARPMFDPGDGVRYFKDLPAIFTMERSTIFNRYKPQTAINDKIEITFWIFPFVIGFFK